MWSNVIYLKYTKLKKWETCILPGQLLRFQPHKHALDGCGTQHYRFTLYTLKTAKDVFWQTVNTMSGPDSPEKSQLAIGFFRNTGTDPPSLEEQFDPLGPNASWGRTIRPSVKYVNITQKQNETLLGPPPTPPVPDGNLWIHVCKTKMKCRKTLEIPNCDPLNMNIYDTHICMGRAISKKSFL